MRSSWSMRRSRWRRIGAAAIADADVLEPDDRRRQLLGGGEVEAGDAVLDDGGDRLHPLQRLDPALRLAGLGGLGAEAVDEGLHVGAGGVLLALLGDELLQPRAAGVLEGVVGALVERELAAVEVQDCADRAVEQVAVVADDQHGVRVAGEEGLEPDRALEVEIVGRLVEQQHVGAGEQHGGQRHPHPPAAGELGAGAGLGRGVEAEARSGSRPARASAEWASMSASRAWISAMRCGSCAVLGLGHQRGALGVGGEHGVDQAVAASPAPPARRRRCGRGAAPRSRRRRAPARRGSAGTAWSCRCRCGRRSRPCARPGSAPRRRRRASCLRCEKLMLRIASIARMWRGGSGLSTKAHGRQMRLMTRLTLASREGLP